MKKVNREEREHRTIEGDNAIEMAKARIHIKEAAKKVAEELSKGNLMSFGIVMAHDIDGGKSTQIQVMGGSLADPLNTFRMADAIRGLADSTMQAAIDALKAEDK